jgi:tryptophan synthase alpha chain
MIQYKSLKTLKNGHDRNWIAVSVILWLTDLPFKESSTQALHNGMTTQVLLIIKDIRKTVSIPLIIMGYFNPMLQFGIENFCKECAAIGIDGLIIPDLPLMCR